MRGTTKAIETPQVLAKRYARSNVQSNAIVQAYRKPRSYTKQPETVNLKPANYGEQIRWRVVWGGTNSSNTQLLVDETKTKSSEQDS